MALFDTQLAMLANQASNALVSGKDPPRQGNTHPNIVPYQPFDAADQPIIIAVGNDRQFARLAEICGHPEWTQRRALRDQRRAGRQPRRDRAAGRRVHPPQEPAAEWLEQLEAAGIPAGPINRISQALADVQAQHRADGADDRRHAAGRLAGAARRRARGFATCRRRRSASIRDEVLASLGLEPRETRAAQVRAA